MKLKIAISDPFDDTTRWTRLVSGKLTDGGWRLGLPGPRVVLLPPGPTLELLDALDAGRALSTAPLSPAMDWHQAQSVRLTLADDQGSHSWTAGFPVVRTNPALAHMLSAVAAVLSSSADSAAVDVARHLLAVVGEDARLG